MKLSIKVYDPEARKDRFIQARTVADYVKDRDGAPLCAWCRIRPLRKLCDWRQHGFTMDFVSTVAYCDGCCKATIIEWEDPHVGESEVQS